MEIFINIKVRFLFKEIAVYFNDLLQAGPEPSAGVAVHLPGHLVEHLHDLRDQRGLSVVGCQLTSLLATPHT